MSDEGSYLYEQGYEWGYELGKKETFAWQPMETAPKDGSEVLIWDRGAIRVARFEPLGWSQATAIAFRWFIPLGKGECSGGTFAVDPTRWMPLPDPPK